MLVILFKMKAKLSMKTFILKQLKKHPNYIIIIVLHIPHVDFVKEVHNTPHG